MKKLIIPSLVLLFSVCKVQAQTTASAHPMKQEKKTMVTQPKKTTNASTTVTVQKNQPVAKGKKKAAVHKRSMANRPRKSGSTAQQTTRRPSTTVMNTNRADTTKPRHTYAKAHMKHNHPAKKTSSKTK